jgi:hypothetical protein
MLPLPADNCCFAETFESRMDETFLASHRGGKDKPDREFLRELRRRKFDHEARARCTQKSEKPETDFRSMCSPEQREASQPVEKLCSPEHTKDDAVSAEAA